MDKDYERGPCTMCTHICIVIGQGRKVFPQQRYTAAVFCRLIIKATVELVMGIYFLLYGLHEQNLFELPSSKSSGIEYNYIYWPKRQPGNCIYACCQQKT